MVASSISGGRGQYWDGIMGDGLRTGKPPGYFTKPLSQLILLPYWGREMSTSRNAVMLCGWGVKANMADFTYMDKGVDGR